MAGFGPTTTVAPRNAREAEVPEGSSPSPVQREEHRGKSYGECPWILMPLSTS